MAKHDYDVLVATNGLVNAAYLSQHTLARKAKELIFIVSLTVLSAGKEHIQSHIRVALELGVTPQEVLEAIEISLPEAGSCRLSGRLRRLARHRRREALESSPDVLWGRCPS